MPSAEQLKLLFGPFPIPAAVAALLFGIAWLAFRARERLYDAEERRSVLDLWPLAVGYLIGHHTIDGLSGLPPRDALDWLPLGLVAMAAVSTALAAFAAPRWLAGLANLAIGTAVLGLSLHGFKLYHELAFAARWPVFAALALALAAGAIGLVTVARRLRAFEFFLVTGLAGTPAAVVLFDGFHTSKVAQLLGLALAVGGAGFVLSLATRTRHVSTGYAVAFATIWATLVSNAYFGNLELPPQAGLSVVLAVPAAMGIGSLLVSSGQRPVAIRSAVYASAIATALLALALAKPAPSGEGDDAPASDPDNPYAEWG